MDLATFTRSVRDKVDVVGDELLESGIRATLATLAERVTPGEAEDLAAQLPAELGGVTADAAAGPERFGRDEFVRRVARRSGLSPDDAEAVGRAVYATLTDAVSEGEIEDLAAQLPADIEQFLASTDRGS